LDEDEMVFRLLLFCLGTLFIWGGGAGLLRGNSWTFSLPCCATWGKNEKTGSLDGGPSGRFGDGVGFGANGLTGLGGEIGFLWTGSGFLDGLVGLEGLRISGLGEGGGGVGRL